MRHRRRHLPGLRRLQLLLQPRLSRHRRRQGHRRDRDRERRLHLRLSADHHGIHAARIDQRRRSRRHIRAHGQFAKLRQYPDASFNTVTAPNADTLYTVAWFDLAKEPWIVSIPDLHGRYALFPMLDGWTDVFQVPGKRTTGTGAQKYALTGPGWSGTLPAGVTEYKSPTAIVWLLGRIYCTGTPEDYKIVHAAQDQMSAVPLSAYGKPYTPPAGNVNASLDRKTPLREQVNALDGASYFKLFAELLKTNPPAAEDAPMVAKLATLGIVPGQDFDAAKLDATTTAAIAAAPKPAQDKIAGWFQAERRRRRFEIRKRLGLQHQDRRLWHELFATRDDHVDRPRRESPAGCRVSDFGRSSTGRQVQRRE